MASPLVSASLLSADPLYLADEVSSIEKAGIDLHHVDVMDGHFVPNLTFGPPLIKKLKTIATVPLDVHLMISNPEDVLDQYIQAGSDWLTFHVEAHTQCKPLLEKIKSNTIKAGLSIKPKTPVSALEPYLDSLDLILVMSVEPGFGGQAFLPETFEKIQKIRELLKSKNLLKAVHISVDGGVSSKNSSKLLDSGATCLVSGSFLYKAENKNEAVDSLR